MELNDLDLISGPYFVEDNGLYVIDESRLYDKEYVPFILAVFGTNSNDLHSLFQTGSVKIMLNPDTCEMWDVTINSGIGAVHYPIPGIKLKLDSSQYADVIEKMLEEEPEVFTPLDINWSGQATNQALSGSSTWGNASTNVLWTGSTSSNISSTYFNHGTGGISF